MLENKGILDKIPEKLRVLHNILKQFSFNENSIKAIGLLYYN